MAESDSLRFLDLYVYTRIWKLAGADIAGKWLNPYYRLQYMKTMLSPWTLAMVSLLVSQTVVGFGMFDVLRASHQLKDSRRDVMAPADVLVHVVLEELDGDNDGQITLGEIDNYYELLALTAWTLPSVYAKMKGYTITIATILDADQSGIVELDELQRAAAVFVTNCGTKLIGWIIIELTVEDYFSKRFDPVVKAGEIAGDFVAAFDTDNDGLVSTWERQPLLTNPRLRWYPNVMSMVGNADQNNDGNLDQSEARQMLRALAETYPIRFVLIYGYTRIWKLAGAEIANEWLHPY